MYAHNEAARKMNENGQNGPKVFASIAKFGETKFKPIRKQENDQQNHEPALLAGKQNASSKIAENQPTARGRVNKFFKSRNPVSVLEETNKPKPAKPANITPIKNESKFKEASEKPLKMKIKKEKPPKPEKKHLSPVKAAPVRPVPAKAAAVKLSPVKMTVIRPESPEFISKSPPPNRSTQTRYGTRSRRPDQIENNSNNNNNNEFQTTTESKHEQPQQLENHDHDDQPAITTNEKSTRQKSTRQRSPAKPPVCTYGTRRSSRRKMADEPATAVSEPAIELEENNFKKLKLNEPKEEEENKMDFELDRNGLLDANDLNPLDQEPLNDLPQPVDLEHSPEQPSEPSQPPPAAGSAASTCPAGAHKGKKRFFSKTERKAVQYNAKNFFSNDDPANEPPAEGQQPPAAKLVEYDSDKLKKVKEAHKCAELGEAEHFDGEISFYLSGIKDKNAGPKVRCLNILGLTAQCLNKPELRMHLRAHDSMVKIIKALRDSPKDPNLALCAACLMFVYNQDRLTFDIDPNALSLMLELLETNADRNVIEVDQKHKEKIVEMCQTMKTKGHGKYLKLSEISAGTLAMETLLGLTSKRAGDWFKEELRSLKGIDYLVDAILTASDHDGFMQAEAELNKIDRSLRVIENVTYQNRTNQEYVINYREQAFVQRCCRLYELCKDAIVRGGGQLHLSPLLSTLRVFTNLTADVGPEACSRIGDSVPDVFDIFLSSVFELPSFVVPDSRFDLIIFLLCLCLNLVESCDRLHDEFIGNQSQLRRLVRMLEERYDEAKKTEQQADDFLDSEETQRQLNAETINIDSILTDLVAKSGKHMEHTIIAACVSLLIGCGLKDRYEQVDTVRRLLPNNSFSIMIDVITKLKEFSNLAVSYLFLHLLGLTLISLSFRPPTHRAS